MPPQVIHRMGSALNSPHACPIFPPMLPWPEPETRDDSMQLLHSQDKIERKGDSIGTKMTDMHVKIRKDSGYDDEK